MHCFSEDWDFAQQVIAWGFVLGIGGIVTYPKNHALRQIMQTITLNDFVLETDLPYLPIKTMRGQTNYPAHIHDIALYISTLKNCTIEQVASATESNVKKIFQI